MDQQDVYNQYHQDKFNEAPQNRAVREAVMPPHMCPSEQQTDVLEIPESGPGGAEGDNLKYRRGSYRCMTGKSDGSGWWDSHENFCDKPNGLPKSWRGVLHTEGTTG